MIALLFTVRSWAIWKTQVSFGPPVSVTPALVIRTPVLHLNNPAGKVRPLISHSYRSTIGAGVTKLFAVVNAVSISATATVRLAGVGGA